ncbi:MAG: hypothetical protein HQL32_13860 [Planctomycetes bacterium]|nr:hypothetical protein [Planctomycetota bacterium]
MIEEHIAILDKGENDDKILYANYDESGRVVVIDAFRQKRADVIKEGGVLEKETPLIHLLKRVEEKYQIKLQTVFCVARGDGRHSYMIDDISPYAKFVEESSLDSGKFSSLSPGKIPLHSEVFDAYKSSQSKLNRVFAVPSNIREDLQNQLIQHECFVESFVALPRMRVAGTNLGGAALILGIEDESCYALVMDDQDLYFYRKLPFSISMMVRQLCDKHGLLAHQVRRMLYWILNPTELGLFQKGDDDQEIKKLHKLFPKIRDEVADELERMTIGLKQHLVECGLWEVGMKKFYLYGEYQQIFKKFTFLRDLIPLDVEALQCVKEWPAAKGVDCMIFGHLLALLDHCYERRLMMRKDLANKTAPHYLREWCRRFLGI